MNFEYLSTSQVAALFLGIIFSVFSVVGILIAIRQNRKIKLTTGVLLSLLCAPFAAFVCWFFLIFSFLPGFLNKEFLSLMVALIVAIIVCVMIVTVTMSLYKKKKELMTKEEIEEIANDLAKEDQSQEYEITEEENKENVNSQLALNEPVEKIVEVNKNEINNNIENEKIENEENANAEIKNEEENSSNENITLEEPLVEESIEENLDEQEDSPEDNAVNEEIVEPQENSEENSVESEENVSNNEDFEDDEDLDAKFEELLEMLKNEPIITDNDKLDDMADDIIDDFQADSKKKDDKKDDE